MPDPMEDNNLRDSPHVHQELTIWKGEGTLVLATFILLPHLDQCPDPSISPKPA